MVIIPKLEYRTQLTFLSRHECDNIIKPFRKLFKQKLHLATSIPNAILENRLIYNFRDFYDVTKWEIGRRLEDIIENLDIRILMGHVIY